MTQWLTKVNKEKPPAAGFSVNSVVYRCGKTLALEKQWSMCVGFFFPEIQGFRKTTCNKQRYVRPQIYDMRWALWPGQGDFCKVCKWFTCKNNIFGFFYQNATTPSPRAKHQQHLSLIFTPLQEVNVPPRNHKAIVLMIINGLSALWWVEAWQRQPLPQLTLQPTKRSTPLGGELIGSWGFMQTSSILLVFPLNTFDCTHAEQNASLFAKDISLSNMSTVFHTTVPDKSVILKSITTWILSF